MMTTIILHTHTHTHTNTHTYTHTFTHTHTYTHTHFQWVKNIYVFILMVNLPRHPSVFDPG